MDGKGRKFVVDVSFVLSGLLPDEKSDEFDRVWEEFSSGKVDLVAPTLLNYEDINRLKSAVIQKRVTSSQEESLIIEFKNMEIKTSEINMLEVYRLAIKKNLSVYDSVYC